MNAWSLWAYICMDQPVYNKCYLVDIRGVPWGGAINWKWGCRRWHVRWPYLMVTVAVVAGVAAIMASVVSPTAPVAHSAPAAAAAGGGPVMR